MQTNIFLVITVWKNYKTYMYEPTPLYFLYCKIYVNSGIREFKINTVLEVTYFKKQMVDCYISGFTTNDIRAISHVAFYIVNSQSERKTLKR